MRIRGDPDPDPKHRFFLFIMKNLYYVDRVVRADLKVRLQLHPKYRPWPAPPGFRFKTNFTLTSLFRKD